MQTGLTLGKFAPFHKGHEYLISRALQEMDQVIVVVYNASETTDIPTAVRADWIRDVFPEVRIILAEDGPQATGYTPEIICRQNAYLQKLLKNIKIDAFYSSEEYGRHVSAALNCANKTVDPDRKLFPVSATAIRKNVIKQRDFLSPGVFNALKPHFYFLGGPSTGKSTLALQASRTFCGSCCEEYGREYGLKHQKNHRLSMQDLETIADAQNELETSRSQADTWYTFCDTNTITTLAYARYYFNKASRTLQQTVENNLYKYKNVFLCNDDFPFENTWDRSGPGSREKLQALNIALLNQYQIPFTLLTGDIENRLQQINTILQEILNA